MTLPFLTTNQGIQKSRQIKKQEKIPANDNPRQDVSSFSHLYLSSWHGSSHNQTSLL